MSQKAQQIHIFHSVMNKIRGPKGLSRDKGHKVCMSCKGKGTVLPSEDLSADFTFYSLVTGPVCLCAISTPLRAYSPAVILAHWAHRKHFAIPVIPGTHLHLSQV